MTTATDAWLERATGQTSGMVDLLRRLVEVESPSADAPACERCVMVACDAARELWHITPEVVHVQERAHVRLRTSATPRVGLLAHIDTVWPVGTLAERPFAVRDGRAYGPGVFDMKAGLVQCLHAVSLLQPRDGVELLITSDEEVGSPTSRALIEDLARRVEAVLVLEPGQGPGGALKVARKGVSQYQIEVVGRAAHAGLEPHRGVNALTQMALTVLEAEELADGASGTTVTPTVARAGSTMNVVPQHARLEIDVRASTIAEQERVDLALRELRPSVSGAVLRILGGPNRPPLEAGRARALYERARALAAEHGLGDLSAVTVGGASDGNFSAAAGTPTLDGLGAVGDGAHAEHEHIVVEAMAPRATLVALLIEDLLRNPLERER